MSIKYKDFNNNIQENSFILLCVLRDEYILLEYFINYYEKLGVTHFIFIDNNSIDESFQYLLNKNDTNMQLYKNDKSFKDSNFGSKWIEELLLKYCKDKWCLTIDIDELLYIKENNLNELRENMIKKKSNILLTMLLDMYSIKKCHYKKGNDFLNYCPYYDKFNLDYYTIYGDLKNINNNTDIYGGVRTRLFKTNCTLTKRNFFKYDFYNNYNLSGGFHALLKKKDSNNLNIDIPCLQYYNDINLILHFKFIKSNIKDELLIKINNNNKLTNTTLNENNNFDIWCKEIKLYLENWKGFEYFNNKLYTCKYSDNFYNYFNLNN
jgi:hypothetical protein